MVSYLREQGHTLGDIGEFMGMSRSHVCMVEAGKRGLTLGRLKRLEAALKCPLPLLLLNVMENQAIPDELASEYGMLREALKDAAKKRKHAGS